MDIQIRDLLFIEHDEGLAWTAALDIDGRRACLLSQAPGQAIVADDFVDAAAREAVRGDPTLAARCADVVATNIALEALRQDLASSILALTPEGELVSVPVPPGGTLDGAAEHLRRQTPGSTILNDLDPAEALRIRMDHPST